MLDFFSRHESFRKLWSNLSDSTSTPRPRKRSGQFRDDLAVPACIEMLERRTMLTTAPILGIAFDSSTGILTITGTIGADAVTATAGASSTAISLNGVLYRTIVGATNSNVSSVVFTGGGGADALIVNGVSGNLTLTLTNVGSVGGVSGGNLTIASTSTTPLNLSATTLASGNLSVTANSDVTNSGKLAVSGTTTVVADNSGAKKDVTLGTKTNAFSGSLFLNGKNLTVAATGAVRLDTTDATGILAVTATGTISDVSTAGSNRWNVTGTLTLNAGANAISLTNTSNFIQGAISLVGTSATINNLPTTILGVCTLTGSLTVIASSPVTNTGKLSVGTTTTITAPVITLSSPSNVFTGLLTLNGTGLVTVAATGPVALGVVTAPGGLNIKATGAITGSALLTVGGVSLLNAGTSAITLTNAASTFTAPIGFIGSNATFKNAATLTWLDNTNLTGNFSVTSTGASGVLTWGTKISVTGTTTINAGAANSISLGTGTSTFGGALALNGNYISVVAKTDLNLGVITAASDLTVTTTGAVKNSGKLDVTGNARVSAGKSDIALNNAANSFGGFLGFTGNNVTVAATGSVVLNQGATLVVTGNLSITSTGAVVNNSAPLHVSGTTNINVGALSDITLSASEVLVGAVSLNGNNITLQAAGLNLGAITAAGTLTVNSTAAVTNSGKIDVTGITTISASGKDVSLSFATNWFRNNLLVTSANATVKSAHAVTLGASAVSGNLALTAVGTIADAGVLSVSGTTALNAGANPISLTQSSSFTGAISLTGTNATLTNSIATVLGTSTLAGTLTITSTAGAVSNSGKLAVTLLVTIDASGHDLSLSTSANTFGSGLLLKGVNVTVNATGPVILSTSTVTGNLSVKTTGAITDSGVLTVTGTSNFNAGTAAITLGSSHDFGGAIGFIGTNATVKNVHASGTILGVSTLSGNLSLVSDHGAVTNNGKMVIGGTTTIDTTTVSSGGYDISVNNVTNLYGGALILKGNNVTISSASAVDFGAMTVTGNLIVVSKGAITDSGVVTVTGTTNLNAGATNNITLNTAGSTYTLAVSLVGNSVSITSLTATDLGTVTTTGTLTVISGGAVTDSGVLKIGGLLTINANAGASAITLNDAGNHFGGALNLNGNTITVT